MMDVVFENTEPARVLSCFLCVNKPDCGLAVEEGMRKCSCKVMFTGVCHS